MNIIKNNNDLVTFLNKIRNINDCSIMQFCKKMGVGYDYGYSLLKGRRSTTTYHFFSIMDELGYNVVIIPKEEVIDYEKTREVITAQDE